MVMWGVGEDDTKGKVSLITTLSYQLVQDFFHQQYGDYIMVLIIITMLMIDYHYHVQIIGRSVCYI